jgi:hypothetical protein
MAFNPLNAELNPICHLLALLGAHHILHVSRIRVKGLKYPVFFFFDFNKIWNLPTDFVKVPSIMFDGNPSSGSRAVHADIVTDERTDMKAIGAFCDYANSPKMRVYVHTSD